MSHRPCQRWVLRLPPLPRLLDLDSRGGRGGRGGEGRGEGESKDSLPGKDQKLDGRRCIIATLHLMTDSRQNLIEEPLYRAIESKDGELLASMDTERKEKDIGWVAEDKEERKAEE